MALLQEKFSKIEGKAAAAVLTDVNPQLDGIQFNPAQTVIMAQELEFYPGYQFLHLADFSQPPPLRRFVLHKPGWARVLDGTATELIALNQNGAARIDALTVEAYTRFYLKQVRGPQGAFRLVEALDDINWREEPPPPVRKSLSELIEPLRIIGRGEKDVFMLTARLLFGDSLFAARLAVGLDGQVRIDREELLREELPVRDEILGQ